VAKKENVPFVVGMFVVNVDGVDLTDKVVAHMKNSKK
jgi:hypothetical protein